MKKVLISITAAASIFAVTACSGDGGESNSKVLVETTAGNVTEQDLYEQMKERVGDRVLREMVENKILEEKFDVKEEEVQQRLDELKNQYGEQFDMVLQQYGYPDEEAFKKDIRSGILREKAMEASVDISEEEMKDYYEKMKTQVKASHILVEDENTANEVYEKIQGGAKFEELAKEYSQDPSAQNGGDLGYFGPGDMVPEFESKAYSLEVGEVSEPVKSQFGYHVIKVTDKKPAEEEVKPYEEMKDEIKATLAQQKADPNAVQKIIDDAEIDIKEDDFKGLMDAPAQEQPPAQ
ncbi:peptidylprolyl isomerase [Bacillus marinisedimentorum]|uniref:peptidylprolyl isomerase n=1 Tax=Bacillus marinisedimentorum TaxID=1821260 RepID=UPI0007E173BE|nr:peptidylprolyl isomerase [Bacillus marinisedimentorum]